MLLFNKYYVFINYEHYQYNEQVDYLQTQRIYIRKKCHYFHKQWHLQQKCLFKLFTIKVTHLSKKLHTPNAQKPTLMCGQSSCRDRVRHWHTPITKVVGFLAQTQLPRIQVARWSYHCLPIRRCPYEVYSQI